VIESHSRRVDRQSCRRLIFMDVFFVLVLVHGQVTIIFVVSVGLSVCLFVVQSFSQPSLIRF